MSRGWRVVAPALAIASIAACGDVDATPIGGAPMDGGRSIADAGGHPSGEAGPGDGGDASAFCDGVGPVLPGTSSCPGDLARIFRFAVCACTSLEVSGQLTTDSFDSGEDAGAPGDGSASIAANGQVSANARASVGGSIWASGQGLSKPSPAVRLVGPSALVAGDVESGGNVEAGGIDSVGGDLWANGDVTLDSGASLSVLGTVHLPAGDTATGVVRGGLVTGPVAVAPPCDCASVIDVASIVAAHASMNDDATLGLDVSGLDDPTATVTLPCGQFYVDGVRGGRVSLSVTGRVALYVAGDVAVQGGLEVALSPGAELDLFVAGNVSLLGTTTLGEQGSAARVRLYVGGSTFSLSASAQIAANVYAPAATLALSSSFEMWGSLFAGTVELSGDFTIHYDASVLEGATCGSTGTSCASCNDCSGGALACKGGTCAPCMTDADCCAPLACDTSTGLCGLASQ